MIVLRRSIDDVEFTTEEVGRAIAMSGDAHQREILLAWHKATKDPLYESWAMQCRAIVDGAAEASPGLSARERLDISCMLQDLVDHLNEPVMSKDDR